MRKNGINAMPQMWIYTIYFLLSAYAFVCIIPLIAIISVSFSSESSIIRQGYSLIPRDFTFYAYEFVFRGGAALLRGYMNTFFVTIFGTLLSLLVIVLFAYPLSRKWLKYRKQFTLYLVFTMLFNGGMVPWYLVNSQLLRITNTYWALILPLVMNAWYVIIMRTFFAINIHDSLLEAAKIDGSSEIRTFIVIVLPLSLPGIATVALFITLNYWNDWWHNLILTTDSRYHCLQYILLKMLRSTEIIMQMQASVEARRSLVNIPSESSRMAMCILVLAPIVSVYPFLQKYFVRGLTFGSLKY